MLVCSTPDQRQSHNTAETPVARDLLDHAAAGPSWNRRCYYAVRQTNSKIASPLRALCGSAPTASCQALHGSHVTVHYAKPTT